LLIATRLPVLGFSYNLSASWVDASWSHLGSP
jgi:hypothetical protein